VQFLNGQPILMSCGADNTLKVTGKTKMANNRIYLVNTRLLAMDF
jgi:hypothetical protein